MGGVAVAEWTPAVEPAVWCLGLSVMVAWFGVVGRRPALVLAVAAAFGLAHALSREATAALPLALDLTGSQRLEVTVVGVVADAPVARDGSLRFPLRLESLRTVDGSWLVDNRVLARWRAPSGSGGALPFCGDRVAVSGWMTRPIGPRNPGQFDAVAWLGRQGMAAELRVGHLGIVQPAAALPVKRAALRVREALAAAITSGLTDHRAEVAVIQAMVLGTRDDMADEIDAAFLHAGTLHIFSVSGLHVGLVAVILWRVLNLVRLSRRQAAWASIPLVVFYALLTGWQPAAVRSALMASVVLLGICLDRPPAFFNSLCLAGLLILAGDTEQLFMAGAQLSFVVMGVIAACGPAVSQRMVAWIHPDSFLPRLLWSRWWCWGVAVWRWLAHMLAVSLVAAVGSAPLTLWHFQLATPVSLVANLVHVPLAGVILATAGVSAAFHAWWPAAASIFSHANAWFARGCLITAGWFAGVPGGSILWNPRSLGDPPAACRITVFDVGDGGAALIRTAEGKAWLIDTGRPGAFRGIVQPGLTYHAVRRLDGMVLSHGDHDHVGGASEALGKLGPAVLGHPLHPSRSPALQAALGLGRDVARPLTAGEGMRLDARSTLTVLWPSAEASVPLADDGCLVLHLECAGRSVVLSNDAGFLAERAIGLAHPGLAADVWVRGRHASDLSGLEDFVRRLRPQVVVCAGRDDAAAVRVSAAWRSMVESCGARVIEQSASGAVEIVIGPDGSLECRGYLDSDEG